jgi:signal transduction histidine kinase
MPVLSRYGHSARWLVPVLYVLSAGAFVADLTRDNMLAYGIIYVPLVATSVFHRGRAGLWIITAVACLLVITGSLVPVVRRDLPDLIGNRILSILAILATAAFVHHARASQERLAAQTRRAEAAERIKSEVLANLSQEMRTPLHSLLGLLNLMLANCRGDQREALARVRSGGRQLLDTIDNLIDLTRIDARPLHRETVDVPAILSAAAGNARDAAAERQIALITGDPAAPGTALARGDAWATRRILDNLIANAIRFAPAGGTVSLSVTGDAGRITVSVSDTGRGLPLHLTRALDDGAAEVDDGEISAIGGTGLTLSNRLARAMGGRLTVRSTPGGTVSLSLPAA